MWKGKTQKSQREQAAVFTGPTFTGKLKEETAFHHLFLHKSDYRLQNLDVLCLPTLRAFGHVELNRLAFLKGAESVCLNRCVVHENILTICTAQKAEPLGIVEPFHCTLFHR